MNEIFQKIAKKRIIALDLEVDAKIKCKPFFIGSFQDTFCKCLVPTWLWLIFSDWRVGLPGTGCDAEVVHLFVLVVTVAPSAGPHSS